jgi:hypothetical protein
VRFRALEIRRETVQAPQRPTRAGDRLRILLGTGLLFFWLLAAGVYTSIAPGQSQVGSNIDREYLIKAAFLYNFGRYVQWPAEAADGISPFVIGVLGPDPFGSVMEQVGKTKSIEGRPIAVRRFPSLADYRPCQILFVAADVATSEKDAVIRQTQDKPVLLVGEAQGFAEQGAVINFFTENNRVQFEINTKAAKQRRLQISSKLLNLGRLVDE